MNDLKKFYLAINNIECPKIKSMCLLKERENYLDKNLARGKIIKCQSLENLGDFEKECSKIFVFKTNFAITFIYSCSFKGEFSFFAHWKIRSRKSLQK